MAIAVIAGRNQNLIAIEGGGRYWSGPGQHLRHRIARRLQLGPVASDDDLPQNRGRGLPQRASLHILREFGNTARAQNHIDRDRRSTQGRAFARRALGCGKSAQMRDVGGERQNPARVKLDKVTVAHLLLAFPCGLP